MIARQGWWQRLTGVAPDADATARWVVLDTETSGLDPRRDRLLAIGAVAVDGQGIRLGDSFEAVVRTEGVGTPDNVVVHGIGHGTQREGMPVAAALRAFHAYLDDAPCVGFHSAFDREVLTRAFAQAGAGAPPARWLDLEPLAASLASVSGRRSLDDWLTVYAIEVSARHNAAGDALATAELLLRLRARAAAQGVRSFAALARLGRQGRWLAAGA